MDILIADLYETRSTLMQKFARQQQAVTKISQVRMDAQFPCISEGTDHLRFLSQIFVLPVFYITPVNERLEVGAVPDAVRRVYVDHLHLTGQSLLLNQRVHHQQ